jgi:hypothetical protein
VVAEVDFDCLVMRTKRKTMDCSWMVAAGFAEVKGQPVAFVVAAVAADSNSSMMERLVARQELMVAAGLVDSSSSRTERLVAKQGLMAVAVLVGSNSSMMEPLVAKKEQLMAVDSSC